jgi:lipid A 3-O-deacylase
MAITKMLLKTAAAAAVLMAFQAPSYAVDSASLEVGTGNQTTVIRGAVQWQWKNTAWWQSNGTHISGYWDLSFADWREKRYNNVDSTHNLYDIGFTPVFRFERDDRKGPYAEAGVGLHLASELYNNNDKHFSTAFQFGDHVGAGYVFNNGLDLGIRLQHLSNGGIKHPNGGVNYALVRVGYPF